MKPLEAADILDLESYEAVRDAYRARVIEHKRARRVALGDRVTLVFEDRETVRYQIQEMTRIERIEDPEKVQHEIDVYNGLLPGSGELSATLFIEIPGLAQIRPELDRLLGIDECVFLEIGADDRGAGAQRAPERVQATFDAKQMEEDRISAVHYVRFALSREQHGRLARGEPAALVVEHGAYGARAPLDDATRASLLRDLNDDPPELLDAAAARSAAQPEPAYEDDVLRVVLPTRRKRAHHYVVEPKQRVARLGDLADDTVRALFERARLLAVELGEQGIAARIVCEVDPKGTRPVCVQVVSAER